MASTFKFELVSPERILVSEDVEQVVVPGSEGDFTVLVGHAPVLSTLRPGVLNVALPGGKSRRLFVMGGLCEVEPTSLTVLAQHALDLAETGGDVLADELAEAERDLAAAKDDNARRFAQAAVDQLRSLQAGGRG